MQKKYRQLKRILLLLSSRRRVSAEEFKCMQQELLSDSRLDGNYLVFTIGACAITTFGMLTNSAAAIIGAMIITPLMLPIRGMAFGALEGEWQLFRRASIAVLVGTIVSIFFSFFIGFLSPLQEYGSEIMSRSEPTLLDLGIAVAAGGISGFAKIKRAVSNTLAGTAIAVALMPPICAIGLGLSQVLPEVFTQDFSQGSWSLSLGATLLYLTNLLGITLSCMIVFLVAGYIPLARAGRGLGTTLLMTTLVAIPLGISFLQLVRQERLEFLLRQKLVSGTVTFQRAQLASSEIRWRTNPPEVQLVVRLPQGETITPKQVKLLEEFIRDRMQHSFKLIFEVRPQERVVSDENSSPRPFPVSPTSSPSPKSSLSPSDSPTPSPTATDLRQTETP